MQQHRWLLNSAALHNIYLTFTSGYILTPRSVNLACSKRWSDQHVPSVTWVPCYITKGGAYTGVHTGITGDDWLTATVTYTYSTGNSIFYIPAWEQLYTYSNSNTFIQYMQPTPCICHVHNLCIWSLHPKTHFHKLGHSHSRVHQPGMFSQLDHSVCTLCHMSTLLHHQRRCLHWCPHDHYWGCLADHKRLLQKMFGWLSVAHASTASLFTTKLNWFNTDIIKYCSVANFSVLFHFCKIYLKGASVCGLNVHNWLSKSGLELNVLAICISILQKWRKEWMQTETYTMLLLHAMPHYFQRKLAHV